MSYNDNKIYASASFGNYNNLNNGSPNPYDNCYPQYIGGYTNKEYMFIPMRQRLFQNVNNLSSNNYLKNQFNANANGVPPMNPIANNPNDFLLNDVDLSKVRQPIAYNNKFLRYPYPNQNNGCILPPSVNRQCINNNLNEFND